MLIINGLVYFFLKFNYFVLHNTLLFVYLWCKIR